MVEGQVAETMPEVVKGGSQGIPRHARLMGDGDVNASPGTAPCLQISELSFWPRLLSERCCRAGYFGVYNPSGFAATRVSNPLKYFSYPSPLEGVI